MVELENLMKEEKKYNIRNPYNVALIRAARILGVRETPEVARALYGIYCEALFAVSEAIKKGAQVNDLDREIKSLDISKHRIVGD